MKVKFRAPFKGDSEIFRISKKAGRTEVVEIDDKWDGKLPKSTQIVEDPATKKAAPKAKAKAKAK